MSAVGPLPWPDARTRLAARIGFHPAVEGAVWGAVRQLLRVAPGTGLRLLLRDLTTLPARDMVAGLRADEREKLLGLFSRMRSGSGFVNDLVPGPDLTAQVDVPALVIASRRDGSVPFAHAEALAGMRHAHLWEVDANSHFIWFGDGWDETAVRIRAFLRLHGELIRDKAGYLGRKLHAALDGLAPAGEVDFSAVTYLSPDACGPLLGAAVDAQRAGIDLVFTRVSPHALRTLRTLGFQRLGVQFTTTTE